MTTVLNAPLQRRLERHPVARLATADASARPHLVPITFALVGDALVFVVDQKPKRAGGTALKRVRNILANPHVAVLVDTYDDDWSRLEYVLIRGRADVIDRHAPAYDDALAALRARYPQYRGIDFVPERNPVIRIRPIAVHWWRADGRYD